MSSGDRINIGLEVRPLSEVEPNTLIMFETTAGTWFRQHNGVVGPKGQTPIPFGDPEVDIVERLEYEPSAEVERWRCKHPGEVAIMAALTHDFGDSCPRDLRSLKRVMGKSLDTDVLDEMVDRGLVKDGFRTPGLSIHADEFDRAYMLTSRGMEKSVQRGIRQEFEAGWLRRMLFRMGPEPFLIP